MRVTCYSGFVNKRARHIPAPNPGQATSPSFEELAAEQGVAPVENFEDLLGKPWPHDESVEEFSSNLREWRRDGCVSTRQ
jgi:hypothetical protein